MKFPKINEYDVALLAIIAWIMVLVFPSFNFPVELNTVTLYVIIPNFSAVPALWFLIKSRINAFLKVFLLLTSWFLIVVAVIVASAVFGRAGSSVGSIVFPATFVQPLLGSGMLVLFLVSVRKPKLRWFNFILLTSYWAIYMPKSFNVSLASFDASKFFLGDFLSFIMPMILYLYLVELRRSEGKVVTYTGKHIQGRRRIRAFRLGHLGAYFFLVMLAMFLTSDLFFLKLFNPSVYLLMSIELASPMVWLLLGLVTISILVLVPVVVMFAGQKIKRHIFRR